MDERTIVAAVESTARSLEAFAEGAELGLVLGSGLSALVDAMDERRSLDFSEVAGIPSASVPGHGGSFVRGRLGGTEVLVMQGRVHAYEGHSAEVCVRALRAIAMLGVHEFILTNAAGGIREDLEPGSLLAIEDHLNLTGLDPGVGLGDGKLGPRFPNLVNTYSEDERARLLSVAKRVGVPLTSGVYAGRLGPSYETPAEIRMLAAIGADVVGMSTVLEAIALRRMGATLVGISCVTNRAAGRPGAVLDHADVQRRGREASAQLLTLLQAYMEERK